MGRSSVAYFYKGKRPSVVEKLCYELAVDARLVELQATTTNFKSLCSHALGVFPTAIKHWCDSLGAIVQKEFWEDLSSSAHAREEFDSLPIDYDWRFDRPSSEALASWLAKFGSTLCLGTPSVHGALRRRGHESVLVDQNPLWVDYFGDRDAYLKNVEEISFEQLGRKFASVVLDPPWYPKAYEAWLNAGLHLVERGGNLVVVLFPRLLRPSADDERKLLFAAFRRLGEARVVLPRVTYCTPSFEIHSLRMHGLPALHGWRTAEVICIKNPRQENLTNLPGSESLKQCWTRFQFGRDIVAVRDNHDDQTPLAPSARELHVLGSVSSLDPARDSMNFVTSSNLAGQVRDVARVKEKLLEMQLGLQAACFRPLSQVGQPA